MQIELLSLKDKAIFTNVVEHESGLVTATLIGSNDGGASGNSGSASVDNYHPNYDSNRLTQLLEHAIEEYNKAHPHIHLALCRVS